MTDTITLPRSVVEQALEALNASMPHNNDMDNDWPSHIAARRALRAALEQPQPLPSPIWRLVPTTMTNAMAQADQELRHAVPWIRWEAILAAAPQPPALEQAQVKLESIEQYQMQMAAISTAALGYWKEGDSIHPDYDTVALRDVAKLHAKYDELYKAQPQAEQKPVAWAEEIIEYLHAYYDTEMIKELDSDDALIRLDDAIAAVEEVAQRHPHPQNLNCKSNQHRLATLWGYVKPQPPRQPLTDEEIIKLAREADLQPYYEAQQPAIERFAALVAAAEREACANLCLSLFDLDDDSCSEAEQCAEAIRARSQQ